MPELIIVKNNEGKLEGITPEFFRQYERFKNRVGNLVVGETLRFSFKFPRSPNFHRRHFALLSTIFDNQEAFLDFEDFIDWSKIGAGHFKLLKVSGEFIPVVKSISYESMDDDLFRNYHNRVIEFFRSTEAATTLWPHIKPDQAVRGMDILLDQFERGAFAHEQPIPQNRTEFETAGEARKKLGKSKRD